MKRLIFSFVTLLLLVHVVSAIDTEIKVKTFPDHEVQITPYKSGSESFTIIDKFIGDSDEYGDVSFISSTDDPKFNVVIYVKKDGVKKEVGNSADKKSFRLLNQISGELLYLELAPEWFELIPTPGADVNITANETNSTIEDKTTEQEVLTNINETSGNVTGNSEEGSKSNLAGLIIFGDNGVSSKEIIYPLIGLIAIVAVIIFIKGVMEGKISNPLKKMSGNLLLANKYEITKSKKLLEAERKLKQAQEEVNRIKNGDKIKEVEKKLLEDERELKKLKSGE